MLSFVHAGGGDGGDGGGDQGYDTKGFLDGVEFSSSEEAQEFADIAEGWGFAPSGGYVGVTTNPNDDTYGIGFYGPDGGEVGTAQSGQAGPCINGQRRISVTVGGGRAETVEVRWVDDPTCLVNITCEATTSCPDGSVLTDYGSRVEDIEGNLITACDATPPPQSQCPQPPEPVCEVVTARNYGQSLPCQYCDDPDALNFGVSWPCQQPVCENTAAPNYGEVGACEPVPSFSCSFDQSATNFSSGSSVTVSSNGPGRGDSTVHRIVNGESVEQFEFVGSGYWQHTSNITGPTTYRRDIWRHNSDGTLAETGHCTVTVAPQSAQPTCPSGQVLMAGVCRDPNFCPPERLRNDGNCCVEGYRTTPNGQLCEPVASCPAGQYYNNATSRCESPPTACNPGFTLVNGVCVLTNPIDPIDPGGSGPTCNSSTGSTCSRANSCGDIRYGTVQCDGTCDAVQPSETLCLPVCSNGLDDDGDGLTDYPNDPGCVTASDDNEIDSPVSITVDPPLVRSGDEVTVSWDFGANNVFQCSVTGPDIDGAGDDTYNPSIITDRTGSARITVTSQAIYTARCNAIEDQARVRLVPVIFET